MPCGGIMMPSVDKAGRYFPFTLVTFLPTNVNLFQMAISSRGWFETAETVALSVLDETPPEMEALDKEIVALGLLAGSEKDTFDNNIDDNFTADQKHWLFPMRSVNGIADILPDMAKHLTDLRFGAYSLWWTSGSEQIEPAIMMCQGLPPASSYAAMIGGGVSDYGWGESATLPDPVRTQ
jgi:type VI secretion system protein ImpM